MNPQLTHRPPIDVAAAAIYLGVGERMVRRLVAERRIPIQRVGRFVMFRPEDLDAWLEAQYQPAVI